MLMEVNEAKPNEVLASGSHVVIFASIGDCKIYHFSKKKQTVTDVTQGRRFDSKDARDPGITHYTIFFWIFSRR